LNIVVAAGVGQGETPLAAFDAALHRCGVEQYNLIQLSSVIPPESELVLRDRYDAPPHEYGHKLFVVKAEMGSEDPGAVIAAGLGWLRYGDGKGVFVEHEIAAMGVSPGELEDALAAQITASLRDLARTRGAPYLPEQVRMRIISAIVGPRPTCALAVAAYQAEGWFAADAGAEG
jgi:arginine decarboxylase